VPDESDPVMRDGFATLGLPRSLLLREEEIESAWRALAQEAGRPREENVSEGDPPGEHGGGPVAEAVARPEAERIHEARRVLRDPVSRLDHWLSLTDPERSGAARGSAVDAPLMGLFESLHSALGAADSVLERHRAASSSLAKALLAREAIGAQLGLQDCLRRVHEEIGERVGRFAAIEAGYAESGAAPARETLGQLKFLRKWERQAQERLVALIGL